MFSVGLERRRRRRRRQIKRQTEYDCESKQQQHWTAHTTPRQRHIHCTNDTDGIEHKAILCHCNCFFFHFHPELSPFQFYFFVKGSNIALYTNRKHYQALSVFYMNRNWNWWIFSNEREEYYDCWIIYFLNLS